jgi:hypothetical protein
MHKYRDPFSGKIKRNNYHRKTKEKQKLQHLYNIGGDKWYPWPVVWSDYEWNYPYNGSRPAENAYLERNYRRRLSHWLKKQGHRKARRYKNTEKITNSTYNKVYDYWWELD